MVMKRFLVLLKRIKSNMPESIGCELASACPLTQLSMQSFKVRALNNSTVEKRNLQILFQMGTKIHLTTEKKGCEVGFLTCILREHTC